MAIDPGYEKFATPAQWAAYTASEEHGSYRVAAAALGLAHDTIGASVRRMKAHAARSGFSPEHGMTNTVPPGFRVKGVSSYHKATPASPAQWVKSVEDAAYREAEWAARIEAMRGEIPAMLPSTAAPVCAEDMLTVYPSGDPHFGLYADAEETGTRFDLGEALRVHCGAVDLLVAAAPASALAIFNDKGDTTHANNNSNRTPKSGHGLDVIGRHHEAVKANMLAKRYQVARMLEKHERVIIRIDPGNHDPDTALSIAMMLHFSYENEPRVEVITSPNPFWYFEWGRNLIGTCHGDTAKGKDLPLIMATDQREAWGRVTECLWIVGHVHHKDIKDYPGATVEYVRTLAGPDAWSHGAGFRSKRDMQAITLHKQDGEILRATCSVPRLDRITAH